MLEAYEITKHYRGVRAVDEVSFSLGAGEALGLIGPNGAGKTTLLNLITGYVRPDGGHLGLRGASTGGLSAAQLARRGLTRTSQVPYLFEDVSVAENVRRAAFVRSRDPLWRQFFTRRAHGSNFARLSEETNDVLDLVGLPREMAASRASSLPYGYRKLASLAMAIATRPEVLCLDEPAAGLNEEEKDNIVRIVGELRRRHVSMILVEHDMGVVTAACERTLALNYGRCIAEGSTIDVLKDPEVAKAYLGAPSNG